MLEVFYGNSRLMGQQAFELAETLKNGGIDGRLLIGYPIAGDGIEDQRVDAILNSPTRGVVLFVFVSTPLGRQAVIDAQDAAIFHTEGYLGRFQQLRKGRTLAVPVNAVTLLPVSPPQDYVNAAKIDDASGLAAIINSFPELQQGYARALTAALQTVTTIKPYKKRTNVLIAGSRGDIMKNIERHIANLDQWQQAAAIECPEGPQRIRGLAGSGKTIVLALKAAYLHATKPNWQIAVVFYSRALAQQFRDLIRRFYFEQRSDEPDWSRISIIHAWGSGSHPGLYSQISSSIGIPPRTFMYARSVFGQEGAFEGISNELLNFVNDGAELAPRYDAILVDEAQDLPTSFFRLAYKFAKEPHRVIFAYDELQTLSESSMPSLDELFGKDSAGNPRVSLENPDKGPRRDIVLPICYRNTPWTLTTAHAVGLGIYANGGLVQHFDEPGLWEDVGYQVVAGELMYGSEVTLERKPDSAPPYFNELLHPDDVLMTRRFETQADQSRWVAASIAADLREGELDADDILVIFPDPVTAQSRAKQLSGFLSLEDIASHQVGVTATQDQIFMPGSIAITHIYRSKGNEAPMVYVLNAEDGMRQSRRVSGRNMLFTAITRSRAWVRVVGIGDEFEALSNEMAKVRANSFKLRFIVPTKQQLEHLKLISRDLSPKNERKVAKAVQSMRELLELVKSGEIAVEQLPPDVRRLIFAADSDQLT